MTLGLKSRRVASSRKYEYFKLCPQCGTYAWMDHDQLTCGDACRKESLKGKPKHLSVREWMAIAGKTIPEEKSLAPLADPIQFNEFWQDDLREIGPAILTCDWHIPYHSIEWVEKMIATAVAFKIDNLYIVGDYTDQHGLSKYVNRTSEDIKATIAMVRSMTSLLVENFKRVRWLAGNHDMRIALQLMHKLDIDDLHHLFLPEGHPKISNFKFSSYPYAYLRYGDRDSDRWFAMHPKIYRRTALSAAKDIATLHLCDIYNTHGHTFATGFHPSGRFALVDGGGMFDQTKIEYKNLSVTGHPNWANGFTVVFGREFFTVNERFPLQTILKMARG